MTLLFTKIKPGPFSQISYSKTYGIDFAAKSFQGSLAAVTVLGPFSSAALTQRLHKRLVTPQGIYAACPADYGNLAWQQMRDSTLATVDKIISKIIVSFDLALLADPLVSSVTSVTLDPGANLAPTALTLGWSYTVIDVFGQSISDAVPTYTVPGF